jgi:hypothetical protein
LPSSTFEIVIMCVTLCELKLTNMNWRTIFDIWCNNKDSWALWIGEQFLTFDVITKIAELYGLEAW